MRFLLTAQLFFALTYNNSERGIGQAQRSISCRGGYFCPGRSRKRSGSAGAWTVPPGGLRFYQLALPNEKFFLGRDKNE